jgi:hypothetical protein
MKKLVTLVVASSLAVASLSAQAQTVTVDGVLNSTEVATGGYVLIGKYTNPRGFGDAGLLSMYAASTATKVYIFLGGTVEANGNAFQVFMKTPASAGVPLGTALPAGTAGTSFEKLTAKMDMAVNMAVALRSDGTGFQIEGATYTNATTAASKKLTTTPIAGDGTAATLATDAAYPALALARVAYRNATGGKVSANPGSTTPTTGASYGGVGTYGLEMELDRTAMGLTGASALTLFALQNGGDGGYISSDFIPQTSAPLTTNSGNLASGAYDFTALPDRQAATLNLAAAGGTTLGTRAADAAAIALGVYPNPVRGASTVTYQVAERASIVHIVLTDLLGRTVRTVENGLKPVGTQTASVDAGALAAGTYLMRVQVGDKVSTSKVSVL